MPIDSRVQLDPDDRARLGSRNVYVSNDGYAYFSQRRIPVSVHSFVIGRAPQGMRIDHINGDKLDNRRTNLRIVTDQVNQINRKRLNRNNASGYRGVARFSSSSIKPWRASITVDYRQIHLGLFATREEAVAARRAAEEKYFPETCPWPVGAPKPTRVEA